VMIEHVCGRSAKEAGEDGPYLYGTSLQMVFSNCDYAEV